MSISLIMSNNTQVNDFHHFLTVIRHYQLTEGGNDGWVLQWDDHFKKASIEPPSQSHHHPGINDRRDWRSTRWSLLSSIIGAPGQTGWRSVYTSYCACCSRQYPINSMRISHIKAMITKEQKSQQRSWQLCANGRAHQFERAIDLQGWPWRVLTSKGAGGN